MRAARGLLVAGCRSGCLFRHHGFAEINVQQQRRRGVAVPCTPRRRRVSEQRRATSQAQPKEAEKSGSRLCDTRRDGGGRRATTKRPLLNAEAGPRVRCVLSTAAAAAAPPGAFFPDCAIIRIHKLKSFTVFVRSGLSDSPFRRRTLERGEVVIR